MTVSVSYLSKNCTTCLFISKSFKELFFIFFKHFLFESGCKGKAYFWTTKTFQKKFSKKFFWSGSSCFRPFVQHFNSSAFLSRKRVQNYCFTTYLPNVSSYFFATFCNFSLTRWFVEGFRIEILGWRLEGGISYTLLLFTRVYAYS